MGEELNMGVMLKCGAVFLHIPKTGGSWVEKALKAIGQTERLLYHRHADMTRVMNYAKLEPPPKRKGLARWFKYRGHALSILLCAPSVAVVRVMVAVYGRQNVETLGARGIGRRLASKLAAERL